MKPEWKRRRGRGVLPPQKKGWRWVVVRFPGGFRTRLGILAKGLLLVVFFVVFSITATYLLYREQEPEVIEARTEAPAAALPDRASVAAEPFGPGAARRLNRVLDKHVAATGLKSVYSLVLSGRIEEGGESHRMQLILRRPDSLRMTIEQPGFEVVRAFDGDRISMGIFGADGDRLPVNEELARMTGATFLVAGGFALLAWNHLDQPEGASVEAGGSGEVDGKQCLQVFNRLAVGLRMDHLIDPETGRELARRAVFPGDGEAFAVELTASDFRRISGVEIPMRFRITFGDGSAADIHIESVRVDAGVLPSIFSLD
jgi:hypothetical protein